jgi:hypothetical protein
MLPMYKKKRREESEKRRGPSLLQERSRYLADFCLVRFRRLFAHVIPGFLTVKHRRHRINSVRSGLHCFFSYANKFGEIIPLMSLILLTQAGRKFAVSANSDDGNIYIH